MCILLDRGYKIMNLSRRDFIKGFGAFVAGLGLGAAKAEAKEVEAFPVPDATVELSTGYEVPIYELEPIESECLKWEQIGRDMLDGYMEGLRGFWPMAQIDRAKPLVTGVGRKSALVPNNCDYGLDIECDTLPECEDCQEFLDSFVAESDSAVQGGEIIPGRNIWITEDGDDKNDGLSIENAKYTLGAALEICESGDVLCVSIFSSYYNDVACKPFLGWSELKEQLI